MICENCGHGLSEGARFCSYCGQQRPSNEDTIGPINELPGSTERIVEELEPALSMTSDLVQVKSSALKAYTALQEAIEAGNRAKGIGWLFTSPFESPTQRIMKDLASRLEEIHGELHVTALRTNSPVVELQAKQLANVISVAASAANIIREHHEAPASGAIERDAIAAINAVVRELASFLK